jgi:hypothetical protein
MRNFIIYTQQADQLGGSNGQDEMENAYKIFVGKHKMQRQILRHEDITLR